MGIPMTNTQWDAALKNSSKISKCIRYKILQLKIIHRAYITPCTLKKIDHNLSKLCWHACGAEGMLMHLLWYCPPVKQLWSDVTKNLSCLLKMDVKPCPMSCVLGGSTCCATWNCAHH